MSSGIRSRTLASAIMLVAMLGLYVRDPVQPALLVVVFGLFVVVATWEPIVALGFVVATLALFHAPLTTSTASIGPSELALGATVCGTAIRWLIHPTDFGSVAGRLRELHIRFGRIWTGFGRLAVIGLALLAIVGAGLLSQVQDSDARAAGLREIRWTLIEPLMLILLLLWHIEGRRDRQFIAAAFVTGGLVVAIWGLADAFSGGGVSAGGVTRADGPFPHPNAFALFLLRPVVFAAAYLVMTRKWTIWAWLACGTGGTALLLSFSRSAALGLVVALIVLWPWFSNWLRLMAPIAAAVVALALVLVAGDRAVGTSGQDSLALRMDIWRAGLAMIRDRPILGYGPDQFLYTYSPRYISPAAWAERFTAHGHNLLIDAWVRVGIIGAVCASLALLAIVRAAGSVSKVRRAAGIDPLAGAAVVALAAAGAQALVDNGYFVFDLALSAWLLAWFAFAGPARQGPERDAPR